MQGHYMIHIAFFLSMLFIDQEPHKLLCETKNHGKHAAHTTGFMSMLMDEENAELDWDEERLWFEENDLLFMNEHGADEHHGHKVYTSEEKA